MRPLLSLAGLILMISSLFLVAQAKQQNYLNPQIARSEVIEKLHLTEGSIPLLVGVMGAAAFFAGVALPSDEGPIPRRGLDPDFLSFMEEMRELRSMREMGVISQEEFLRRREEIYAKYQDLFRRYLRRSR